MIKWIIKEFMVRYLYNCYLYTRPASHPTNTTTDIFQHALFTYIHMRAHVLHIFCPLMRLDHMYDWTIRQHLLPLHMAKTVMKHSHKLSIVYLFLMFWFIMLKILLNLQKVIPLCTVRIYLENASSINVNDINCIAILSCLASSFPPPERYSRTSLSYHSIIGWEAKGFKYQSVLIPR